MRFLTDKDQYCQSCGVFIGHEGECDDCQEDHPEVLFPDHEIEDEDDYLSDF